jgi:hypothetical protein
MKGYNADGDWDARLIPFELLDTPLTTKRKIGYSNTKSFKLPNQIIKISSQTNSFFFFTEPPSKNTKTKKAPAPPKKTKTHDTINIGASTFSQPTVQLPHTFTSSSIEMELPTLRCETISENNEDNTSLSRVIITRPIAGSESSTSSLYRIFNQTFVFSRMSIFLYFHSMYSDYHWNVYLLQLIKYVKAD